MHNLFKYKLVSISSKDAIKFKSNSEFSVQFSKTNHPAFENCVGCSVVEIAVPNIFYNIRTGINDKLYFQEAGQASADITLEQGFYTVTQLTSALKTKMDTLLIGGTVAVALTPLSKVLEFTFTGTTAQLFYIPSTIADTIGLKADTAAAVVLTMDYIPKLNGLTNAFIRSNSLGSGHLFDSKTGQKQDGLKVIPITVPFGATELYSNIDEHDRIIFGSERNLSLIDFRLTNADNEVLDLQQHHLKIILKLFYL